MRFVRHVHCLLETEHMQRQRNSKNKLGNLIQNDKNYTFLSDDMNSMHGEWTKYVHRKHKETVIFSYPFSAIYNIQYYVTFIFIADLHNFLHIIIFFSRFLKYFLQNLLL